MTIMDKWFRAPICPLCKRDHRVGVRIGGMTRVCTGYESGMHRGMHEATGKREQYACKPIRHRSSASSDPAIRPVSYLRFSYVLEIPQSRFQTNQQPNIVPKTSRGHLLIQDPSRLSIDISGIFNKHHRLRPCLLACACHAWTAPVHVFSSCSHAKRAVP